MSVNLRIVFSMTMAIKAIIISMMLCIFMSWWQLQATIVTVDSFPDTEQLNSDLRQKWIHHHVRYDAVPLNESTTGTEAAAAVPVVAAGGRFGALPYICYNFESCDLISTRVVTRSKRSVDGKEPIAIHAFA